MVRRRHLERWSLACELWVGVSVQRMALTTHLDEFVPTSSHVASGSIDLLFAEDAGQVSAADAISFQHQSKTTVARRSERWLGQAPSRSRDMELVRARRSKRYAGPGPRR